MTSATAPGRGNTAARDWGPLGHGQPLARSAARLRSSHASIGSPRRALLRHGAVGLDGSPLTRARGDTKMVASRAARDGASAPRGARGTSLKHTTLGTLVTRAMPEAERCVFDALRSAFARPCLCAPRFPRGARLPRAPSRCAARSPRPGRVPLAPLERRRASRPAPSRRCLHAAPRRGAARRIPAPCRHPGARRSSGPRRPTPSKRPLGRPCEPSSDARSWRAKPRAPSPRKASETDQ